MSNGASIVRKIKPRALLRALPRVLQRVLPRVAAGFVPAGSALRRFFLVCLLYLAASCRAQQAPARPSFEVAGTVVNALSGDPVAGAVLRLLPRDGDAPLAEARSGDDGHFRFAAIPAGKYQLQAGRRGYTRCLFEQHDNFNSAVVVAPGEDTSHLVFHLPPLASIRGVVMGDGGEPVEAARVQIYRKPGVEDPAGRIYRAATANTDDTGAYEFADLPPGTYLLAVLAQPWWALHAEPGPNQPASELDVAYPVTYYDSTSEEASATPIRLTAGAQIEANISLRAVRALRITVAQPSNRGDLPNPAELRQSIFGAPDDTDRTEQMTRNSRGETEFFGVAPGHYELVSGVPAYSTSLDATSNTTLDGTAGTPSARITGKVETAPGVAYEQYAMLTLAPADPNQQAITTLVSGGKFRLPDVPAGVWTVQLRNGYGHDLQVNALEIAGRLTSGSRFTATGQSQELAVTATEGAGNVVGFAQKDGHRLAGVMVVLVPRGMKNLVSVARRDQTDSDGSFTLLNVVPGEYTVVALEDAWELDWSRPELMARYLPAGESVTVPGGTNGELRLAQPVAVQPR